jgi:integrase
MRGIDRRLTTLGRYPDLSLKNARDLAKRVLVQSTGKSHNRIDAAIADFLDDTKRRVTPGTYGQYHHYLHSFDFTGTVGDLTKTEIKKKLATLNDRPTAQNMAYATLRAFLNWCLRHEYIDKHPLLALTVPNAIPSRERVLLDTELKALWDATGDVGSTGTRIFNRIVRVLILTGQRRMEIATLKEVSDVMTFTMTKNKLTHTIPITPLVMEHLQVPFQFNDWSGCKHRLDKRCGVTDWVLHDLRRTFSTNCAKLGIPIHITERILNHRSGTVSGIVRVYNRYSYLPEMLEALLTHERHIRKIVSLGQ